MSDLTRIEFRYVNKLAQEPAGTPEKYALSDIVREIRFKGIIEAAASIEEYIRYLEIPLPADVSEWTARKIAVYQEFCIFVRKSIKKEEE